VSTLGGNTIVPPFLVADKLGWGTDVSDSRYRWLLAGFALVSAAGPFVGGAFFPLLVLVLAFGLVGTPFALVVVLVLLNSDAVPEPNSRLANLGGGVLVVVTAVTAGSFVRSRITSGMTDPMTLFVVGFAAVLTLATLVLVVQFARTGPARRAPTSG
jgi:manganese transport protein